jgi:hypothetical protein
VEDFFDQEKLKAKVFLLKDGDTSNMAMVTDGKLMVVREGKKMLFSLAEVKALESTNKKLLFPLILGGIVAPFAFLSYFTNMFHPLLHLLLTLLGLLLFYVGWAGRAGLLVRMSKGHEEIVYLPSISKHLLAFIDYINGRLSNSRNSGLYNFIFIEVVDGSYNWLYSKQAQNTKFPCLGYTYKQLMNVPVLPLNVIAINPELAGREIRFVFDVGINEMRPQIDGPVNESALIKISDSDIL